MDPILIITIVTTLYAHSACLFAFITIKVASKRLDELAVARLCRELRFPEKLIFQVFTQGESCQHLRITAVTGSSSGAVIAGGAGIVLLLPFLAFNIFVIISGLKNGHTTSIPISVLQVSWMVLGVVLAYRYAGIVLDRGEHPINRKRDKTKRGHASSYRSKLMDILRLAEVFSIDVQDSLEVCATRLKKLHKRRTRTNRRWHVEIQPTEGGYRFTVVVESLRSRTGGIELYLTGRITSINQLTNIQGVIYPEFDILWIAAPVFLMAAAIAIDAVIRQGQLIWLIPIILFSASPIVLLFITVTANRRETVRVLTNYLARKRKTDSALVGDKSG